MSFWARSYPWQLRCVVDSARAIVPFQRQLRQLQDRALGFSRLPSMDNEIVRWGLRMLEWVGDVRGAKMLEIGSGWQPIVPILFSLSGATVYMTDRYRLMRHGGMIAAIEALRDNKDEIVKRLGISPSAFDEAIQVRGSMEEQLLAMRLVYEAPCDCRDLRLASESIDVVISRSVLEHVPQPVMKDILLEAGRILRPGGSTMHIVDNSDHWAHRDTRICAVNFLKFDDWQYRMTCLNPLDYTNRMRHSEYLGMLETTGFRIQREEALVDQDCLAQLPKMKIAERFQKYSPQDLAVTTSLLLAERPLPPKLAAERLSTPGQIPAGIAAAAS